MNMGIRPSGPENANHKYLCWLDQVKGIGRQTCFLLLQAAAQRNLFSGETEEAEMMLPVPDLARTAELLYTAPQSLLRFLCSEAFPAGNRADRIAGQLMDARKREPDRILEELDRNNIFFSCILEENFPVRLRNIPDPPFGIYYKGSLPAEEEPTAGVIGARLASGYGREQARRFAWRLGKEAVAVVSGMARGIDGIAQKAALDAGGRSFAVLGCGVDICYPDENRELYDRLLVQGGILSEYPPGTPPESKLFPPRNRIISGLSDLIFVIEARKKSGTLITVDMALEQGREVFALPGRVSDSLSDGCNRLIRQGAGAATCPEDILEYFFGTAGDGKTYSAVTGSDRKKTYPEKEKTGLGDDSICAAAASPGEAKSRFSKKKRTSLEKAILNSLSEEGELHLERLLEGVNRLLVESGEQAVQVTALIPVLMRLQIDREVREEAPGYYTAVHDDSG